VNDDDRMPTPGEWERLLREWRDDASQRPLRDKGVSYEDEYDRQLDELGGRSKYRPPTREDGRER
jgi:hypothetical protein